MVSLLYHVGSSAAAAVTAAAQMQSTGIGNLLPAYSMYYVGFSNSTHHGDFLKKYQNLKVCRFLLKNHQNSHWFLPKLNFHKYLSLLLCKSDSKSNCQQHCKKLFRTKLQNFYETQLTLNLHRSCEVHYTGNHSKSLYRD